jgi:signal transduction histidine kinase
MPIIQSDQGRLQQVFLNIFNNAIDAVDDGGRIDVTIARQGPRFVSIKIRDNGKGISAENRKHIFEPFFTTNQKHGTGLGLSITYGMVNRLGGTITVDSKLGEWTEFAVLLPIKPEATE